MTTIVEEFEGELATLRGRYAAHPERELVHLLLLALEREEVVAVGYREALLARRLAAMPITDEVRELVGQALAWTWQDEEMHAVYLRGALLRRRRPGVTFRARLHRLAGMIGGWTASVRQHLTWTRAPLTRLVAAVLTTAGELLGKVPTAVRRHLRHGSFGDFCRFNVEAERTAARCFERMRELAQVVPGMPAGLLGDLTAVIADEERHCRLFAVLAEVFTADDRLADSVTLADLAGRIAAIDISFVPRRWRSVTDPGGLGSAAPVAVVLGSEPAALLDQALAAIDLPALLVARAAATGRAVGSLTVAIKPSFMFAYHRADPSPMTDPRLVLGLAQRLLAAGCAQVRVIESPSVYGDFFAGRTVAEVAAYVGYGSTPVVDASAEQVLHRHRRGLGQHGIAATWAAADLRVSFGKLRSHPVDTAMLTLSNLEWLGAPGGDLLFAERQAQRDTATMMQVVDFPPHLALLDATVAVPDGVTGMLGCRRPLAPGRLYAGRDALAVDTVAARHLGVADPRDALFLRTACRWLGVGQLAPQVLGCDLPLAGWRGPRHSGTAALLSLLAFPLYVFASGRGALFVPVMDPQAFPPRRPVGAGLRVGRWAVRRLLGLPTRHPAATP